jgi:hypothetical protein
MVYGGMDVSTAFSWPRHQLEVSGQLHAPVALLPTPTGEEAGWTPKPGLICRSENSWPYRDLNSDLSVVQAID